MQTVHYQIRVRQRGISEPLIQLIYNYGQRFSRPGGVEAYVLGGKGVDRATKDIKKILQAVPKLKDVILVTNGEPITVYHHTKENLRLR